MSADYYKILQVDRKSNDDDLKRAFRKLEAKFKEICQAYDVLSDPRKRSVYDQYGEEGLKQRFSPRSAQRFSPRSADDVFSEFFGPSSPFGGQKPRATNSFEFVDVGSPTSVRVSPQNSDDVYSEFFGGGSRANTSSSSGIPLEDMFGNLRMDAQKEAAIEQTLPCSLEELYKGTSKKMKISREVTDAFGRPTTLEEILPIEIKPGWKKGTKITFPKKGNEREGFIPSDLVFIIDEKPHGVFKRDGNDLVITQRIPLVEALTGYTAQITTLDGRNLTVPINAIITPTYEEVVVGEGMPVPKEPSKKGNLTIKFNVLPSRLTSEQKSGIKRLLTLW